MKNDKDIPISRAVGRFFGHLWHSTTKPVDTKKETTTVSKSTQESQGEINGQKVTLRKTTIEEIEINDQA
ncbi:MAG: hypothetical protein RLN78_11775 [Phycisphaerales bacterium]